MCKCFPCVFKYWLILITVRRFMPDVTITLPMLHLHTFVRPAARREPSLSPALPQNKLKGKVKAKAPRKTKWRKIARRHERRPARRRPMPRRRARRRESSKPMKLKRAMRNRRTPNLKQVERGLTVPTVTIRVSELRHQVASEEADD